MTTPVWEDLDIGGGDEVKQLAASGTLAMTQAANDSPGPSCIVYDEELAEAVLEANTAPGPLSVVLNETDAFSRTGDKGPYHWLQGPQDVTPVTETQPPVTPPVDPSPNPEPATPGVLPRKGNAVTISHLRIRQKPGKEGKILGVMPTGTEVSLTGARKRVTWDDLWVRVEVEEVPPPQGKLGGSDFWLVAPPGVKGWVDAEFLAVPASEYQAEDFPAITHQWLWFLDDPGEYDPETVKKAITAITEDPRGPRRAGIDMREATRRGEAHILIRMVDDACGGAAGCYYKKTGEAARADIAKKYFNTSWFSRVLLHEAVGHGCTRSYDHYTGAPQYPRPDYAGLMGNWQDHYGDHAWPDLDDIENWVLWLQGASPFVYVRDVA
jgi:SH3 domain-containing protein